MQWMATRPSGGLSFGQTSKTRTAPFVQFDSRVEDRGIEIPVRCRFLNRIGRVLIDETPYPHLTADRLFGPKRPWKPLRLFVHRFADRVE
jgi:hypothetical protein